MSTLYYQLSGVYDAMYHTFINYPEEVEFYSDLLEKYNSKSVLEIGCGTGNLAAGFIARGFTYQGLDLSNEMIKIATSNNPQSTFLQGDMRNFRTDHKPEACIITGRTVSYLLHNKDVLDALQSINSNLPEDGILCFDFIDANKFIPQIKDGQHISHSASFENKQYQRDSYWEIDPSNSWTFKWQSVYYWQHENGREKIGEDNSVIRAFCKDDILLFLHLAGFIVQEIIPRASYAFDTFVVVAKKA